MVKQNYLLDFVAVEYSLRGNLEAFGRSLLLPAPQVQTCFWI